MPTAASTARNTLVTSGLRHIVVSSVGAMSREDPATGKRRLDSIGWRRWYETMCFVGHEDGGYIEADVSRQVSPKVSRWGLHGDTEKDLPPTPDLVMDEIH